MSSLPEEGERTSAVARETLNEDFEP